MAGKEAQQFEKSTPYGYAFLVWNPRTQNLVVTLNLTGLVPDTVHPSHIHQGSCASMGPIVYSLNDVMADGHGNAFTTTVIPDVAGVAASGWCINVHHGPGLATLDQMASIYCGNIANTSPTTNHIQIIKVQLNPSH